MTLSRSTLAKTTFYILKKVSHTVPQRNLAAAASRRANLNQQRRVGAVADCGGWEKHNDHR
jgi:hypothetical protein